MTALATLSNRLCPWLEPALERFASAQQAGSLGHAWLLSGPEGIGKINLALVLARRLLGDAAAPRPLEPDAALEALATRHEPADGHPDLHWLHPEEDRETISVDQVRDVIETLTLTAHRGAGKVAVIEPAEALTAAAANALLKTLEEPSAGAYLLLVSHQPGRLAATIRSRCQHMALHPPAAEDVAEWLGVAPSVVAEAARWVGTAPLRLAAAIRRDESSIFSKLESDLAEISRDELDPQAVAQAWTKGDTATALGWLKRRLHEELRARLAPRNETTEITVPAAAALHNAWRPLPARVLFEQYARAETLSNQLGSGLNVELALQAMLSALVVSRGRS